MRLRRAPLPSICWACTRWRGERQTCEAYPDGVPEDILGGVVDHAAPRGDEQGGVVFDLAEGSAAFLRAWTATAARERVE